MPPDVTSLGGQGGGPDESRSDLALFRSALRQDWPIPPRVKAQLLRRAIEICDPETEIGAAARPRLVLSALKIIALYCNLAVKQQAVDLARERLDLKTQGDGSLSLPDLVADAERAALESRTPEPPQRS